MRINKIHLILTILLFLTEVLIAIFLKTGFIRHTFGDFLVVILIYCFFKSFFKIDSKILAIAVLLFALCIELLQLINILSLLDMADNYSAKLLLGSTFQFTDLVAYALGIITILLVDLKFISNG
ncbi:ribosomal maturation YjgA family protein [Hyunsoonleella ulvae]|uniref:ribosomal maturation YjgA family protein n=1 Tax=Hyunsoonleella ulvae TaxID=2799948 RepID=UPI00193995BF|nr:DUF2809 domain-containing protein [Hyunsoonleella ulvae]